VQIGSDRPRLVLASASPARRRLLAEAGIDAEVIVSGVDESVVDVSGPDKLCLVLARLKAQAVADQLRQRTEDTATTLVLGCDSVLAFEGDTLGKPADAAEATRRWRRMRGRCGVLYTGHCLVDLHADRLVEDVAAATVYFAEVTDDEIAAYVATGEPLRVAGAFTIDGIGGPFVERIDGDPGTVIGLSLPLIRHLLRRLGVPINTLWRTGN
jgi:nucleoside triphosphate pyrophosphatase